MPLGTEVGLDPFHIMSDGDPALPTERGTAAPHVRGLRTEASLHPYGTAAHVYCGQTGGWIRMKLGTEVCLGPKRHCVR